MAEPRNQATALEALANGTGKFVGLCNRHGETQFLAWEGGRSRCVRCNNEAVANRRREIKRTLVAEARGKCVACGFDRHQAALQFHHRERGMKKFALSRKGHTMSLERARAEAKKCTLLCANCHALVEAGVISVS
ncbi:MAG: hypothetical protein ACRDK9_14310 [Solirubrobacterales bacterium]